MVSAAHIEATPLAAPFLKWAGGKTQLLAELLPRMPRRIKTYYEPFIGGGALFFALANESRFQRAVLADANEELVETYTVVRDEVDALIEALETHASHATDPDYFYEVRAWDVSERCPVSRAARLIFLNKTCFNGLYRVNKKGHFNVPFGRYAKPRVLNIPALLAASAALQRAEIVHGDFEATTARQAGPMSSIWIHPTFRCQKARLSPAIIAPLLAPPSRSVF